MMKIQNIITAKMMTVTFNDKKDMGWVRSMETVGLRLFVCLLTTCICLLRLLVFLVCLFASMFVGWFVGRLVGWLVCLIV